MSASRRNRVLKVRTDEWRDDDLYSLPAEDGVDPFTGAFPSYRCDVGRHHDCEIGGAEDGCSCGCHNLT